MLFNSFPFLYLLLLTFALYYLPLLRKLQVYILILASSVFYAYFSPGLLLLLYFSVLVNIVTSYYIIHGRINNKRLFSVTGVVVNLAVLFFFKYSPLLSRTFFSSTGDIGTFLISIPLPIGISFYTFQGISLMVDTFRDNKQQYQNLVAKNFFEHGRNSLFYISFFPQLVAGPIVKAHDFLPQINTKYFNSIDWEHCFKNIVIGYFLKMVVADNLKEFTFWIEYPYFLSYKPIDLLAMLFGFSCQIFADFAGYSSIAIGVAGLFGYKLKINFNFPYIATTFKDFWKRWHISLSSFLMEYLYFPLGGNKKGQIRTYINLFIVMALGGLWHGARWSYLVWGVAHGILLASERFICSIFKIDVNKINSVVYSIFIFIAVTFAWLLFKLPDFRHVLAFLDRIFHNISLSFSTHLVLHIIIYSLPVVIYHMLYLMKIRFPIPTIKRIEYLAFGSMLFFIITSSGNAGEFIYFQF